MNENTQASQEKIDKITAQIIPWATKPKTSKPPEKKPDDQKTDDQIMIDKIVTQIIR